MPEELFKRCPGAHRNGTPGPCGVPIQHAPGPLPPHFAGHGLHAVRHALCYACLRVYRASEGRNALSAPTGTACFATNSATASTARTAHLGARATSATTRATAAGCATPKDGSRSPRHVDTCNGWREPMRGGSADFALSTTSRGRSLAARVFFLAQTAAYRKTALFDGAYLLILIECSYITDQASALRSRAGRVRRAQMRPAPLRQGEEQPPPPRIQMRTADTDGNTLGDEDGPLRVALSNNPFCAGEEKC